MSQLIVIGEVRAVHGLKGHFKITSYTETPDDVFRYGPCRLGKKYSNITLKKLKELKTGYIASCEQIKTRELAEKIVGLKIEIDQSYLPAIKKLTENARKTVFDDPLEAIFLKPCYKLWKTTNPLIINIYLRDCTYTFPYFFIKCLSFIIIR